MVTNLKESKYNYFIEDNDKIISYNTRTNALARLDIEFYRRLQGFLEGNKSVLNYEEIKNLVYGGFLIDENIDELDLIKHRMNEDKYNNNIFGLTIATTLKCNFACPYCYEQGEKPGEMPVDIQEKVVRMIESKKNTIKKFQVTWYGGEPLMGFNVIKNLGKKFIEICKKNNIEYSSSIVTNGYLLTREKAEELVKELKVTKAQITIDGPPSTHNKTRILHNGDPTFNVIIDNLLACQSLFELIHIRVNVTKKNYLEAMEINQLLKEKGLEKNVSIYFAKVDANGDMNSDKECFSDEQFDNINMIYQKSIGGCNRSEYPSLKSSFCMAAGFNGIVVDSAGYLYKCWENVGFEEAAIGHVDDENDPIKKGKYTANLYQYVMHDPTQDPHCNDCKELPICMGGCPIKRIKGQERCISFKYNLEEKLKYYIKSMNKMKNLSCGTCQES